MSVHRLRLHPNMHNSEGVSVTSEGNRDGKCVHLMSDIAFCFLVSPNHHYVSHHTTQGLSVDTKLHT